MQKNKKFKKYVKMDETRKPYKIAIDSESLRDQ